MALEDVEPPAELRLYCAAAAAHVILGSIDGLVAVDLDAVTSAPGGGSSGRAGRGKGYDSVLTREP